MGQLLNILPIENTSRTIDLGQKIRIEGICMLLLVSVVTWGWTGELPVDLTALSLDELMEIEVTLASKKEEKLFETAAAVYAVSSEEIRRSGVTSIAEALRMVPGMQVARIDANKWAISARGFNSRFANKLLVLIDGRSVYTPLFSGVYWEAQDFLLEDLEHIEVIRGSGATLWGANAVNGIINIITKKAQDTQGGLVTLGVGTEEHRLGGIRYGGKWGGDVYYRVYAKYFDRDSFVYTSGEDASDEWDVLRGGFRMDWEVSESNALTLQGHLYEGTLGQTLTIASLDSPFEQVFDDEPRIAEMSVLGKWKHIFSDASNLALQFYYDRSTREEAIIAGTVNTFDVDFQHRLGLGAWQEMVWGTGYRFITDDIEGTYTMSVHPGSRRFDVLSAFVQDEIKLINNRLRLMLGSKFEHNDYTGFEIQPNVRLLWMPHERHTIWGVVSRAVRTPTGTEDDVRFRFQVVPPDDPRNIVQQPIMLVARGSPDFESEELVAHELGYRVLLKNQLSFDMTMFYNVYDNLRTGEPGLPIPSTSSSPAHYILPITADNKMYGDTYGMEWTAAWQVLDGWRLHAAYTYLKMQLHIDAESRDSWLEAAEEESPNHQFHLRSSMDLGQDLEFDLGLRYVDDLPSLDVEQYFTLDARVGWKPHEDIELSVVCRNLSDDHHPEFGMPRFIRTLPTEVERGIYGAIRWRF